MDLQEFMPRYTTSTSTSRTSRPTSRILDPTSTPKKRVAPRRPLPPPPLWEAPPPDIPPRNPLRLARTRAQPHTPSPVEDPDVGVEQEGQEADSDFAPQDLQVENHNTKGPIEEWRDVDFTSQDSPNVRTVNETPTRSPDTSNLTTHPNDKPTIRQVVPSDRQEHEFNKPIASTPSTTSTHPPQKRSSLSDYQLPTARLALPSIDQRLDFSLTLHEEIEHLRKSYIEDADDVFFTIESARARIRERIEPSTPAARNAPSTPANPTTPLRCSASARTPIRNFSLPSYGSPVKQATPARPLRRVRSRSLGFREAKREWTVFEPVERARFGVARLVGLPEARSEGSESPKAAVAEVVDAGTNDQPNALLRAAAILEPATALENTEEAQVAGGQKLAEAGAAEVKPEAVSQPGLAIASTNINDAENEAEEEACLFCNSTRRALARNPLCCIDRPNMKRVCFKCWSDVLAQSLTKEKREEWLCCAVCGRELVMSDVKRLAGRATVLRFRIRCAASRVRGSLALGLGKASEAK